MEQDTAALTYEARVERLIDASPEAVFDAFMTEAAQAEWFTEPNEKLLALTIEPRLGGTWSCEIEVDGECYSWSGAFTEFDRPRRFVAELVNLWGGEEARSTFDVTCEPHGDGTRLTVIERHPTERDRDAALGGLPSMVEAIGRFAEQRAAR